MKAELHIACINGEDPERFQITIRDTNGRNVKIEITAVDMALAMTGRLVHGELKQWGSPK